MIGFESQGALLAYCMHLYDAEEDERAVELASNSYRTHYHDT